MSFFSYSGYHYKASAAISEAKNHLKNCIIFCGHQHMEAIIKHSKNKTANILPEIKPQKEKISEFALEHKEISLEDKTDYIIRVGLGGPEGYYGTGFSRPHFGLAD